MKFKVRELLDLIPVKITDSGFILGIVGPSVDVVRRPDGTTATLPSGIGRAQDINNAGLVMSRDGVEGTNVWLFDSVSGAVETFAMPGFKYLWPEKINNNGDVVGSVAELSNTRVRRGFIRRRQDGAIVWVSSTAVATPPGVAFLYLNAINDLGHAVGTQGTASDPSNPFVEAPIYYDGSVHQIGSLVFSAGGDLITSNDRMRVSFTIQLQPDAHAIYDRATDSVTQFPSGFIIDYAANGMMLWQERGDYFFRWGGTQEALLPWMSGWSQIYARSMNASGLIVGHGLRSGGGGGGFVLEPSNSGGLHIPDLVARILWGILNDAGGVELVGGILNRIPPHSPLNVILDALPQELRSELTRIVHDHRLENPIDIELFSARVRQAVTLQRRQQLHRDLEPPSRY